MLGVVVEGNAGVKSHPLIWLIKDDPLSALRLLSSVHPSKRVDCFPLLLLKVEGLACCKCATIILKGLGQASISLWTSKPLQYHDTVLVRQDSCSLELTPASSPNGKAACHACMHTGHPPQGVRRDI